MAHPLGFRVRAPHDTSVVPPSRGWTVSFLVVLCSVVTTLGAGPQEAAPPAGAAAPIPHPDILELFGDRGQDASMDDSAAVGQDREAAAGSVGREASQEIKHPDRDASSGDAAGGVGFGSPGEKDRDIRRGQDKGRSPFWDFLPLLAVLGLIFAAALAVKRFMPARRLLTGSGVLEIVARLPLSGKQTVVLVRMGRRLLLLGVTAEQISTLGIVDEPEQVATMLGEAATRRTGSMTRAFARTFEEEADAYRHEPMEMDAATQAGGHIRGLLEKVRQFKRQRDVA